MHKNCGHITKFFELSQATWRAEDWGDMHVSFEVYHQEFDDRPYLEGLPGNHCQCPHWGYVIKGRVQVLYSNRQEEVTAGEAYYLAPGHTILVDAGTELIEFSPHQQFNAHMAAIEKNLQERSSR